MGLDRKSLAEFFREGIEQAQKRHKLSLLDVTQFYVVNLLSEFVEAKRQSDLPLALILKGALEAETRQERCRLMREIGDKSLYVSGFFPDSLKRKIIDVDYYMAMGEQAYRFVSTASREGQRGEGLAEVFDELARKFAQLVDLIGEISERSGVTSDADLLRLYERWLATRSERLRQILNEKGILPQSVDREPVH